MFDNKIEKLGRMVKTARKEQGLTQGQLAAVSGVGTRFIRELEQGKTSCHNRQSTDRCSHARA